MSNGARPVSLRRTLLLGILLPVLALVTLNTFSLYQEALETATTAYDRTLLASAKTIGEQIDVSGFDDQALFTARVPYAALEAFEADNQSQLVYKVSSLKGSLVSGYEDLPAWTGKVPLRPAYAALVDFYDDQYRGSPVRVAALVQPVASTRGRGIAVIQVAETLELREALAREMLIGTLWRQGLLLLVIATVVVWVVQRATRPVRVLSEQMQRRAENDFTPLVSQGLPRELWPLVKAANQLMGRLNQLLDHQRRFVRDTSHQLRTPLAVLKAQVQSAKRGDQPADIALREIEQTVDRATRMANQMLALAKVEQLREQAQALPSRLDECVRSVALDLAPLVADKDIDFDIRTEAVTVLAHEWMLNELSRNLLHNAVKHTPPQGRLLVEVSSGPGGQAALLVRNEGAGLTPGQMESLFQPFVAMGGQQGAGLGLAICQNIVQALGGRLELANAPADGLMKSGVQARVWLDAYSGESRPLKPAPL